MDDGSVFDRRLGFDFIVLSPAGAPDPALPIAGARAGALGVLNLEFCDDQAGALVALSRLAALGRGRCGALLDGEDEGLVSAILAEPAPGLDSIILSNTRPERLRSLVDSVRGAGLHAYSVATSLKEAKAGQDCGVDAVIAKGHEAGGRVGEEGSFVLLQRCITELQIPIWMQGGIGVHTAAASYVAGAAGAALDSQLLLARETPLPDAVKSRIAMSDGSETACLGGELGAQVRIYSRPDLPPEAELREVEEALTASSDDPAKRRDAWRVAVRERVDWRDPERFALAVGQDASFAADLAHRFHTVGGILGGLRDAIAGSCRTVQQRNPFAEGAPLAESHRTRYPLVQGPMTRVSDRAEFAQAVAEGGALPFLALALMRAAEVRSLLEDTQRLLGDRAWGVGILGFVPAELRAEQIAAIRDYRPPFALIAGGRPDQARTLEDEGISTYLHVPSPGLLQLYLDDGARRFVFEGRECGGHVGPRTSFVLIDTMVRTLLEKLPPDADGSDYHVLFAGGIHDGRSAAMVAAAAAALVERGIRVGALLGTAYLFTEEAVRCGAITSGFQRAAIASEETVLLETGPGHATRCLPSRFVDEFNEERRRMRSSGVPADEMRGSLEALNVGRLRIAAKGVDRHPRFGDDPAAPKLIHLDDDEQRERGMFMIGQVAALRDRVCPLAELNREIAVGSAERLEATAPAEVAEAGALPPADVAIVGIGCILPGAADIPTFWANIVDKVDAVTEVPPSRWDWHRYFDPDRAAADKVYSRWGGFIDDVPFDPVAFGMPPNSLRSIEPFQLLGLLTAQAALRDAGYGERPFPRERTSVILGAGGGGADLAVGYTVRSSLPLLFGDSASQLTSQLGNRLPEWTEDSFPGLLMNVAAGRIANRLDLGGVNYTVDAACASSLAAVYLAVRDLQTETSDMALVGGVDAIQNPFAYLAFSKSQALSPSGRCRPFDAEADGIAISEGFATVVLKRLADAERDGDRIYAVIRGVAGASDGRDRSLTAPRPEGQMRALRRAYAHAGISPATVGLVEAHGTGTVAGDRAEVEAVSAVFAEAGAARQECAIGSVKSMIGHTKATAGVAGLIKTALALHHRVLPPTLGVTTPNKNADFPASPFYVNTETRPWIHGIDSHPRRAALSAFGFGGTDFHAVLEEYTGDFLPDRDVTVERWPAELFVWRGRSRSELLTATAGLLDKLDRGAEPRLADLAYTLAVESSSADGDGAALAIVAESLADLSQKLRGARDLLEGTSERRHAPEGIHYAEHPMSREGSTAFVFAGQGSQYVNMAREVAVVFPEVRECFERADRVLAECHERPLSSYVFPTPGFTPEDDKRQRSELTATDVAQPALGATDIAYLHLLRSLGVEPQMVAGHSYGEFVALAAAGSLSEGDLLRLSEARGRFIREAATHDSGAMAAVDAGPEALESLVAGDSELVLANFNAPQQTVISGARASIEKAIEWCKAHGLPARQLSVACGFHSPSVAPAQRRLAEVLGTTRFATPRVSVFSNTTAAPYPEDPDAIAELLGEHLIRPVEFVREIRAMHQAGGRIFVEVGPRAVLSDLVSRILGDEPHLSIPVDQPGRSGLVQLLHCLAALAAEGVPVRTEHLFRGRSPKRLDLAALETESAGTQPSPSTWLVNGGGARPLHAPADAVSSGEEVVAAPAPAPEPAPAPASPAPVAIPEASATPAGDGAGDVMGRHQQLMQRFLETQKTVMLAYLRQPGASGVEVSPGGPPARALPGPAGPAEPDGGGRETDVAGQPAADGAGAEPAQEQQAPSDGQGALTSEQIADRLLALVSERTGYPVEMLSLDADLEAELSIDSIKRVEIAGTLAQSMPGPEAASLDVEEMTASRTLREVIAVLEKQIGGDGAPDGDASAATTHPPEPTTAKEEGPPFDGGPPPESIGRFLLEAASVDPVSETAGLASEGVVVIVDDERGVGEGLAERLARDGHHTVRIVRGDASAPGPDVLATPALGDPEAVAALVEDLSERHGQAKALVYLAALAPPSEGEERRTGICPELTELFLLSQALREDLEAAAEAGGAAVIGATGLGGAFAVDGLASEFAPERGAISGFLKTLAQEWPAVRVKAVDLSPAPSAESAEWLLAELTAGDGLVEVGYRDGERTQLKAVPAPLGDRSATPPLDNDSVVVVTGGARGITAEAALTLAESYRPILLIVGRTVPEEEEEDPGTAELTEPRDLKRAIMEQRRQAGLEVTPVTIEDEYRSLVRKREIRDNLARLRDTGSRVEYLTCDVRDRAAFGALIDDVYETYGRIDGVIHGAGITEDKLVRDKQPASFERVVSTKAAAAGTLAEALRPDTLRFLVFFSSVSGRFGNRGQADYAAASEALNKLAQALDRRWPARVVSINWGPWQTGGMVSPEVKRQFAERGVELIPAEAGRRMMDEELRLGAKGETEVMIGGARGPEAGDAEEATPARDAPDAPASPVAGGDGADDAAIPALLAVHGNLARRADGAVELLRSFDPARDVYLTDHRIDGHPVLPFAVAMELMAEVATAGWPALGLAEIREIRLLRGVTVDGEEAPVRVVAMPQGNGSRAAPSSGMSVEVVVSAPDDDQRQHYRATVDLAPGTGNGIEPVTVEATAPEPAPLADLDPFPMSVEEAYRSLLFHGRLFQGIAAIEGMDERGARALLRPSAASSCLRGAAAPGWVIDPILVDCAFQMQVLWARLHWDVTLLPAEVGSYRPCSPPRGERAVTGTDGGPVDGIRHELRIRPESRAPLCHADHHFYGPNDTLLGTLTDVVGAGSKALNRLAGEAAA
jgi:acyl transferase domain-containing protein/NAD(P)H-dependent flavin oxidoreductase YrpB (nitropropane dioxygenase family)